MCLHEFALCDLRILPAVQLVLGFGSHAVNPAEGVDAVILEQCAHWVWLGHQRFMSGCHTLAIEAYGRAGILGAPCLVACLLLVLDVEGAITLALRVAEVNFADGFRNLKRFVSGSCSPHRKVSLCNPLFILSKQWLRQGDIG
jgi:hypothetical protein